MKYSRIPKNITPELGSLKANPFDFDVASKNPSYFAHHFLGITPYRYQHMILKRYRIDKDTRPPNRLAICKPRQIGISVCLAALAIWYVMCSNIKTGVQNNCKVGIISRSDDQAKKLMSDIQNMIFNAKMDLRFMLKTDKRVPLNKKEIHFTTGWIKCYAPTDSARGECEIADAEILLQDGTYKKIKDIEIGDYIISSDHYRLVKSKVVNKIDNGVQPVIRFLTHRGKEITVTHNHPLMTQNGWVEAKNIKITDRLACPHTIPLFGNKSVGRDKARLVGYLMGDGHCNKFKSVGFTNADKPIMDDFVSVCKNLNAKLGKWIGKPDSKAKTINIYGNDGKESIKTWLKDIGLIGHTAKTKYVLPEIFSWNKEDTKEFLNAYFSCDGWIFSTKATKLGANNRIQIACFTASKKLAFGLQSLLLKFGITATIRKRIKFEFVGYEVGVKDKHNCETFLNEIGILGKDHKFDKSFLNGIQQFEKYRLLDFVFEKIKRIEQLEPQQTYGITVDKTHCYISNNILSHNSFDLLIVDEAAFIDDAVFRNALEPTVAGVNGKIILSSTPNGQKGYYWEMFDPNDVLKTHEYERYWFHWKMCENETQKRLIRLKLKHSKRTGNIKMFDQEYNAMFTVDEEAFFEDGDVERGISNDLTQEIECHDLPCSVGIDYGMTQAATSITVVAQDKNQIKMLFQFAQKNFDMNLLTNPDWDHSVHKLKQRYNPVHFVVDDCPQGMQSNQYLEKEGFPIIKFNFRSDQYLGERNRGYYVFRSALKKDKIKYPNNRNLTAEMKTVQESKIGNFMRIKAPRGYNCDRIDSLMMACYPFLSGDDSSFSSYVVYVDQHKEDKKVLDYRHDYEWDKLVSAGNMYDFYLKEDNRGRPKKVEVKDEDAES